jgi:hypothetical protein
VPKGKYFPQSSYVTRNYSMSLKMFLNWKRSRMGKFRFPRFRVSLILGRFSGFCLQLVLLLAPLAMEMKKNATSLNPRVVLPRFPLYFHVQIEYIDYHLDKHGAVDIE